MEQTDPKTVAPATPAHSTGQPITTPPAPAAITATPATPAVEDLIDIEQFLKVKFRIATIESAEMVPKSKKLLKLQVDLGPLGKRQILSGIALHYTPESLIGKKVVVVANLKTAKLMGLESQGMLLAASTEGDTALAIITPEKEIPAGSVVR
jgi:methionyl-tRNA synthetase